VLPLDVVSVRLTGIGQLGVTLEQPTDKSMSPNAHHSNERVFDGKRARRTVNKQTQNRLNSAPVLHGATLLSAGHPVLGRSADDVLAVGDVAAMAVPVPTVPQPSTEHLQAMGARQFTVDHRRIDATGARTRVGSRDPCVSAPVRTHPDAGRARKTQRQADRRRYLTLVTGRRSAPLVRPRQGDGLM
jgi:hypothetical protein